MNALPFPSLHLVTDRRRLRPEARTVSEEIVGLESLIDAAVEAGIDLVQIRERDLEAGVLFGLVVRAAARASGTGTRIVVNERADVARAAGAAGVHLPSTAMAADRLRSIDPAWIVGRSIHAGDIPADRAACDYLLFGTVFASESKGEGSPVAGTTGLEAAVRLTRRPIIAIGGITPEAVESCLAAGASGVAAIGAFLPRGRARGALGIREAVAGFRAALAASAPRRTAD